jgi:hypothetical protein
MTIGDARGGVGAIIEYGVTGVALEPMDSRLTGLTTSIKSSSESSSSGDSFLTPFCPDDFSAALAVH